MAGNGPAPKESRSRARDNAEWTKLVTDGRVRGPRLPAGEDVLPDGGDWHPQTKKWWHNWRTSPQASRMLSAPDWDYLLDTALMHHAMWAKGRWEFAAEIRLRVANFGATPADRLRLRTEIEKPERHTAGTVKAAGVTDLDERRARLLG